MYMYTKTNVYLQIQASTKYTKYNVLISNHKTPNDITSIVCGTSTSDATRTPTHLQNIF